ASVVADERNASPGLAAALIGTEVVRADRIGKLVLLRTDGPTLGLHFGMTGRLIVDEVPALDRLEYGSSRDLAPWDRFCIEFADGGVLRVNDPRRWATFTLDPDVSRLGPDLFDVTADELASALGRRRTSVKAVLLDQRAIAGLGNLLVDELLWQSSIDPARRADELLSDEVLRLHATMRTELPAMLARGGSHTGTISPAVRALLPPCPRDGAGLTRRRVGGRTTVSCLLHQR
ncbi:MAG TPA: DNA-formamidopyrimidine glycosylase family protein, partial [Polyangiaceae bacterium]